MKITNEAQFDLDDLLKSTKKITFKNTYKFFFIGGALFITGICLFIAANTLESNLKYFSILFTLIGILFIGFPFLAMLVTKLSVKNHNKLFNDGIYYKYIFEEDFFITEYTSGENVTTSKMQYDKLFKIEITKEEIFLYTGATSMYIVKKSGFPSISHCEEFTEFISNIKLKK